ncbi:MAG: tetratricopeptide repeat protein [bacterium]
MNIPGFFARSGEKLLPRIKREWTDFKLRRRHCAALIFIALFAVYYNSLDNGWVSFDDIEISSDRRTPARPTPWAAAKTFRETDNLLSAGKFLAGRPLRNASIYLDKLIFADDPWGFHLLNLIYQFFASFAAFLAAAAILRSNALGLLSALLFTLHPAQTESIAYVAGRRDILSGGFFLYAFYFLITFAETGRGFRAGAALLVWLMALLSKQSAVILPAAFLAYLCIFRPGDDARPLRNFAGRRVVKLAAIPVVALMAVYTGMNIYVGLAHEYDQVFKKTFVMKRSSLPGSGAAAREVFTKTDECADEDVASGILKFQSTSYREPLWYGGSILSSYRMVPVVLGQAVYKTIFPLELCGDYSRLSIPPVESISDWRFILSLCVTSILICTAFSKAKKMPVLSFSIFFFFIAYAPMLPLMPSTHNLQVFAEHWLYLPVFGFSLSVAYLAGRLYDGKKILPALLASLLLLAYSARTFARNRDWKDAFTFWSITVEQQPLCARALNNLGTRYMLDRDDYAAAKKLFKKALEVTPGNAAPAANLAQIYISERDYARAETLLKEHLNSDEIGPNTVNIWRALALLELKKGNNAKALALAYFADDLNIMSYTLFSMKRFNAAEIFFKKIVEKNPADYPALNSLGRIYHEKSDYTRAIRFFEKALQTEPKHLPAIINLALANSALNRNIKALGYVAQALHIDPESEDVLTVASSVYRKMRKNRAALRFARKSSQKYPDSWRSQAEYALVCEGLKDWAEAVKAFEKAVFLNSGDPDLRFHYADALWKSGRDLKAYAELYSLTLAHPDYLPARQAFESVRNVLKKNPDIRLLP